MNKEIISYPLTKSRVAVQIQKIGNRVNTYKVIDGSISILDTSVMVRDLPKNYIIVDENGTEIKPIGKFLITTETINPYHWLIDMF